MGKVLGIRGGESPHFPPEKSSFQGLPREQGEESETRVRVSTVVSFKTRVARHEWCSIKWTTNTISHSQHPLWLGMMGAAIQQDEEGHKVSVLPEEQPLLTSCHPGSAGRQSHAPVSTGKGHADHIMMVDAASLTRLARD